jgi:hypothetical protein
MSYRVDASFSVDIANSAVASALGGGQTGDQRATVQAAADAGLRELESFARRYGFTISDATATVREAD